MDENLVSWKAVWYFVGLGVIIGAQLSNFIYIIMLPEEYETFQTTFAVVCILLMSILRVWWSREENKGIRERDSQLLSSTYKFKEKSRQ